MMGPLLSYLGVHYPSTDYDVSWPSPCLPPPLECELESKAILLAFIYPLPSIVFGT